MITIETLAERIETGLNRAQNPKANGADIDGKHYVFRTIVDLAEYKKAERLGNAVTYYINGLYEQDASNIETSGGETNMAVNSRLTLLIPIMPGEDADGNRDLNRSVRALLDSFFGKNETGYVKDPETPGVLYSYIAKYAIATAGSVDLQGQIGECVTMTVYINWTFVQNGASSKAVVLRVDDEQVIFNHFSMRRANSHEFNLSSSDDSLDSKAINTGSALTISFDMPSKLNAVGSALTNFLLYGERNVAHLVSVELPIAPYVDDGEVVRPTAKSETYLMTFDEETLNAEGYMNTTTTVSMVQIMTDNDIVRYSDAAKEHLGI